MHSSIDWIRLARYLSEECAEMEVSDIELRIQADPDYRRMIHLMKSVWIIEEATPISSDVQKIWYQVSAQAGF